MHGALSNYIILHSDHFCHQIMSYALFYSTMTLNELLTFEQKKPIQSTHLVFLTLYAVIAMRIFP